MSLSSGIKIDSSWATVKSDPFLIGASEIHSQSNVQSPGILKLHARLGAGIGDNQVEEIHRSRRTVSLSSPIDDIDLYGVLNNPFCQPADFAYIKSIEIYNRSEIAGENLTVGGAGGASNAWSPMFDGDQDSVESVRARGMSILTAPLDGLIVRDGSDDILRVEHDGSAGDITYDIVIIGTVTPEVPPLGPGEGGTATGTAVASTPTADTAASGAAFFCDLQFWMDSDAGVEVAGGTSAADGDLVKFWNDQSGTENRLEQGVDVAKPTYRTGILNGKPIVRFDGVDDHMTPSLSQFLGNSTSAAFFAVCKLDTAAEMVLWEYQDHDPFRFFRLAFNTAAHPGEVEFKTTSDGGIERIVHTADVTLTNFNIYFITIQQNGLMRLFVNGELKSTTAVGVLDNGAIFGKTVIGTSGQGTLMFDGDVADLGLCVDVPSDDFREALECVFADEHAISVAHCAGAEVADSPWADLLLGKLFLQSAAFGSTIKTSVDVSSNDPSVTGITFDGGNTPWSGTTNNKLFKTSGQFSSTIKTSLAPSVATVLNAMSWDGTNTPWLEPTLPKAFLQSGQFSSTIKTSTDISTVEPTPEGISYDGDHTPLTGTSAKLYRISGQFSTTVKTSIDVSGVDTGPTGISWDGANTPWSGSQANKLYMTSSQFTSTLKDSVDLNAIVSATSVSDVCTNNISGRLGS